MVFIEVVFDKTENNKDDKKIAFEQLAIWYLHNECKNNQIIKERGIEICKKFLNCPFIDKNDKNEIKNFLK